VTVVLVSTTGGHLTQLHKLAGRLPLAGDRLWVTHRGPQSESLLAGEEVAYVPYIDERDVRGVLGSLGHAREVARDRQPTAFVSTGSAIAVGYLGWAALRGIPSHYIDTAARPGAPSRTGRILARWPGVTAYTQYPGRVGCGWRFAGSVFDEYTADRVDGDHAPRSVLVTVGSTDWPFGRLLQRVAEIVPRDVEIRWQAGTADVSALHGPSWDFLPASELRAEVDRADVVVSHAGCGSALTALDSGRAAVLVPRSFRHGEAGDDHQQELAHLLSARDLAVHRTVDELAWPDLIEASRRRVRRVAAPPLKLGSP
jgi:UDP-N-acetylglucosamine transferase subunit ALG13